MFQKSKIDVLGAVRKPHLGINFQ